MALPGMGLPGYFSGQGHFYVHGGLADFVSGSLGLGSWGCYSGQEWACGCLIGLGMCLSEAAHKIVSQAWDGGTRLLGWLWDTLTRGILTGCFLVLLCGLIATGLAWKHICLG